MDVLTDWLNPIPTLAESGIDPQQLAHLVGDSSFIYSLAPRDVTLAHAGRERRFEQVRFIGSAAVVRRPLAEVRRQLLDYESYLSVIPSTTKAKVHERHGHHTRAEYVQSFKLPLTTLHTRLMFQHSEEADGGLSTRLLHGDVDAALARWELHALPDGRTLLSYTSWTDIASGNALMAMLLKSQPDLAVIIPYGAALVIIEALRRHLAHDDIPPGGRLPTEPSVPAVPPVSADPILARLVQHGPMAFIHKGQWLYQQKHARLRYFVTTAGAMTTPHNFTRELGHRFERFPEFFSLAQKAKRTMEDNGFQVDWNLGVNLGLFTLGIDYRLRYRWLNDDTLRFTRLDGDLAAIDGQWQWQPLNEGEHTLTSLTVSADLGDRPPFVLRFAKQLPFEDTLFSLYAGLMLILKLEHWLPTQIES